MDYFEIYLAENLINGKIYIGYSKNFAKRLKKHKQVSGCSRVKEKFYFQRAISKYGINNFNFSVIESCSSKEDMIEAEKFYIAYFKGLGAQLYNLTGGGEGCSKRIVSEETKEKMRAKALGRKHSIETKEKLRKLNLGKKLSAETIEKTASKLRGRTILTNEQISEIKSMYSSNNLTYKKISKVYNVSDTTIANMLKRTDNDL